MFFRYQPLEPTTILPLNHQGHHYPKAEGGYFVLLEMRHIDINDSRVG